MPEDPNYFSPERDERDERADSGEMSPSAIAILNQSEHAAMVQTANLKGNRRNLAEFDNKLMTYATYSQRTALTMFYTLPRGDKRILGASIRFAEVLVPCWKNCAVGSRVMGDASDTVTAQGVFIDYEANTRWSIEVPRRITDKNNNRFNADMIVVTSNAASAIARRNAVLSGVPRALWTPAYEAAMETAAGKAVSQKDRIEKAIHVLTALGVTEWQILNSIGVASPAEISVEQLVTLASLYREINKGEHTIEEVFGSPHDPEIDSLFKQLGMNETQRRLLRESHMGRAEALLKHLRERIGGTTGNATTAPAAEQSGGKAPRGSGKKNAKEEPAKSDAAPSGKESESPTPQTENKPPAEEKKQPPTETQPQTETQAESKARPEPEKPATKAPPAEEVPQTGKFKF